MTDWGEAVRVKQERGQGARQSPGGGLIAGDQEGGRRFTDGGAVERTCLLAVGLDELAQDVALARVFEHVIHRRAEVLDAAA